MKYLCLAPIALLVSGALLPGCGGTSIDDGTGDAGGSTGSGGHSGALGTQCEFKSDCVAVANTNAPCYSQGCSLPIAVNSSSAENDECLVLWEKDAPARPAGCGELTSDVLCSLACAAPVLCAGADCVDGECQVAIVQDTGLGDASDCSAIGTGGAGSGGAGSGGAGSGGAGSGGAGSGGAGSGGAGSGGAGCEALDNARVEALKAATQCTVGAFVPECSKGESIPNECGCPVLVNDNTPDQLKAAQDAYDTWKAECEPPSFCDLVDCSIGSGAGTCPGQHGTISDCSW